MRASDTTAAFTEAEELEGGRGKGAWDRVWDGQVWCLGWWAGLVGRSRIYF